MVSSNSAASVVSGGGTGTIGWVERRGGHLAEALDVHGAAAADVLDAAAQLRRAAPSCSGSAGRRRPPWPGASGVPHTGQFAGHDELALGAVAQLDHRAEHLGDDVARLAQHDGVADEHALGLDDVLVVQRSPGAPSSRDTARAP